jgi:transcriptional regulator with XRE-family HTH domain
MMDDARVGSAFRAVRIRRGWTQASVALRAGVSRAAVSRIECGHFAASPLSMVRGVAAVLGISLDVVARWHGGDLDRVLNRGHNALHESVARLFQTISGWVAVPEVSYSVFGERGVIDLVAWHEATRSLLIIELKTVLVDPEELVGSMDKRARLGRVIGRERGWSPRTVSVWVILTDTRTNRRHVQQHATMLRSVFPDDGPHMRGWLMNPAGRSAALSFLSDSRAVITRRVATRRGRVVGARPSAIPPADDAEG